MRWQVMCSFNLHLCAHLRYSGCNLFSSSAHNAKLNIRTQIYLWPVPGLKDAWAHFEISWFKIILVTPLETPQSVTPSADTETGRVAAIEEETGTLSNPDSPKQRRRSQISGTIWARGVRSWNCMDIFGLERPTGLSVYAIGLTSSDHYERHSDVTSFLCR